ncbi:MAG TPA: SDR family oxidoreductase [Actinomycetales bacterium]
MSTQDMTGRTALVTGGGSGLGRATTLELAGRGAHVVAADIDLAGAEETAKRVEHAGGSAEAVRLDVTDSAAVDALLGGLFEQHGTAFDVLVNNAGTDRGADIPDVSDEQWHAVFGVNTHGPMHTSRAFVRGVLAAGDRTRPADIVSVVSISALTVGSGAGAYNSSKAALLKLTEVLQSESRERGWPIRVCALNPAAMATPMMDQWGLPPEKMMDPAQVARIISMAVTLPGDMVLQTAVVTTRVEQYPR